MDNPRPSPTLHNRGGPALDLRVHPYRLVLLLALILLGLARVLTVEWPRYQLRVVVLQSPLTVTISLVWPMVALLVLVSAGVSLVSHRYPVLRRRSYLELLVLWPLPTLTAGLGVLLLRGATTAGVWALGIAMTGVMLCSLIFLEYVCLSERRGLTDGQSRARRAGTHSWAEWTLQALAYLLALAYFILIYQGRLRTLLSAPATFVVGGLLAFRLFYGLTSNWRKETAYGLATGLTVAEATWALNYWPGRSIVGGVLLLLIFYVLTGLGRRSLEQSLTKSAMVEYAIVALLGLGILLRFG